VQPFRDVKALLRRAHATADLVQGSRPSTRSLLVACLTLGAAYGVCMALYGLIRGTAYGLFHVAAVALKVPALFLLTLAVTAPSLLAFSALARSSLTLRGTLRLLLAASAASLAVLASFAPVTAFFTFSTRSHPFMQVLNAGAFAIAGAVGLAFVHRGLADALPAEDLARRQQRAILLCWTVVYMGVGAQMAWILRPFVGSPKLPQELFRGTESNILHGLLEALRYM
jgi:hypothetical protein